MQDIINFVKLTLILAMDIGHAKLFFLICVSLFLTDYQIKK
jgi:hypothetical protein